MRYALAALVVALPALGHAQPVDDGTLQTAFDGCVESCRDAHARGGYCNEICGCMTGEMDRHWDEHEFRARIERLQADAADPAVRGEMDRLARYCAARIR